MKLLVILYKVCGKGSDDLDEIDCDLLIFFSFVLIHYAYWK